MTSDDETTTRDMADRMADVFVYAPIGLFFESPSLLPKLAEQGRVHARNARFFGQFAIRQGEAELRRRVGSLEEQATGVLRMFGILPDDEPEAPPAPAPHDATTDRVDAAVAGNGQAGNGHATSAPPDATTPGPAAEDLAILDYDSLSASQVVTRLEGLTPNELEAVRAYESANRGRKTILNKVAQLQT